MGRWDWPLTARAICLLRIPAAATFMSLHRAECEALLPPDSVLGGKGGLDGLAFDSAGDLFVSHFSSDTIYELTPGGAQSTFAYGLNGPTFLAFQGVTLPVPEPSVLGLLVVSVTARLISRHCKLAV